MSHPIRILAVVAVVAAICTPASAGQPRCPRCGKVHTSTKTGRKAPVPFVNRGDLVQRINGLNYRPSNTPNPPPGSVVFWDRRSTNGGLNRGAHATMVVPAPGGSGHLQMQGRSGADNRTEILRPGQLPTPNRGSYVRGTVYVPPRGANLNWNQLQQLQGVPRVNSRNSNCFGAVDAGLLHLVAPRSVPPSVIRTHPGGIY